MLVEGENEVLADNGAATEQAGFDEIAGRTDELLDPLEAEETAAT